MVATGVWLLRDMVVTGYGCYRGMVVTRVLLLGMVVNGYVCYWVCLLLGTSVTRVWLLLGMVTRVWLLPGYVCYRGMVVVTGVWLLLQG